MNLLSGRAPKKLQGIYFLCVTAFLLTMFLIAQAFYPGGYTPLNNFISNQGGIANNPRGHVFFILGAGISGILLIPHVLYIYRHLAPTAKLLSQIAALCGIIGAIGFSLVGWIPEDFAEPHDAMATVAFSGFGASAFFSFLVSIRKLWLKEEWPSLKSFVFTYSITITMAVLAALVPTMGYLADLWNIDPRWFSWPPWQWASFFNVLIWFINVYLSTPCASSNVVSVSP